MVATSTLKREFREINRRIEVGVRCTDEGLEKVARLQAEAGINKMRLEC